MQFLAHIGREFGYRSRRCSAIAGSGRFARWETVELITALVMFLPLRPTLLATLPALDRIRIVGGAGQAQDAIYIARYDIGRERLGERIIAVFDVLDHLGIILGRDADRLAQLPEQLQAI